MANTLSIDQIAQVANAVNKQAYGESAQKIDASNFVTVAQTQLLSNYDLLTTALSQVLSKTIFSSRAYDGSFKGLQKDAQKYGNHVRKVNYLSLDLTENDEYKNNVINGGGQQLLNGVEQDAVDQWKIRPQGVVQTNFYGADTYQTWGTFWKDQLDQAFESAEQFGSFVAGEMNERRNELIGTRENLTRTALLNLIAGVVWSEKAENTDNTLATGKKNVVHLLTEYNTATGQQLTKDTVMQGENYKNFMQFVYAKIATLVDTLKFRTELYHFSVNTAGSKQEVKRFTPKNLLHFYALSDFMNKSDTMVLANTFHDSYLKGIMDYETVPFWQTPADPNAINITANVLAHTKSKLDNIIKAVDVSSSDVVGVLFDDEAIGVTQVNQWQMATPMNARGGYSNYFWHETTRYWNDFTENAIVLCMD